MKHTQADLEQAIRHVTETEARVVEQQARIARLRRHGQPTENAENLLAALQIALDVMKAHLGTLTDPDEGGNLPS
jgi:hypothetical protein